MYNALVKALLFRAKAPKDKMNNVNYYPCVLCGLCEKSDFPLPWRFNHLTNSGEKPK